VFWGVFFFYGLGESAGALTRVSKLMRPWDEAKKGEGGGLHPTRGIRKKHMGGCDCAEVLVKRKKRVSGHLTWGLSLQGGRGGGECEN